MKLHAHTHRKVVDDNLSDIPYPTHDDYSVDLTFWKVGAEEKTDQMSLDARLRDEGWKEHIMYDEGCSFMSGKFKLVVKLYSKHGVVQRMAVLYGICWYYFKRKEEDSEKLRTDNRRIEAGTRRRGV